MTLNLERIAENEAKIAKLDKDIQRSMARKKKLMDENARLTYSSICEQYNSSGIELLELLKRDMDEKIVPEKSDEVISTADSSEDAKNSDEDELTGQMSF